MKVSTRILSGYGILIVLTIAVLAYQVYLVHQLNTINRGLSELNLNAARTEIRLLQHVDVVAEFLDKYFITKRNNDPRYAVVLRSAEEALGADLTELRKSGISPAEREAIQSLTAAWSEYQSLVAAEDTVSAPKTSDVPAQLSRQLDAVRVAAQAAFDATQNAIQQEVDRSVQTSAHAQIVSWTAGATAVALSLLVSALIVWSIARRLRSLTKAVHAVSEGQFHYRVDETGRDEFADVARDFNSMAQRLSELDQLKKDFVSHVSHDLKGPLASSRETIHLLLKQIPGPLNDKQTRLLSLCLRSSERLSSMIEHLLDVSRMEAGMMDYQPEARDLAALARAIAGEFEGLARERNIELVIQTSDDQVWAECDGDRITQVIGNFLENALKFSPASSRVILKVEARGPRVVLSVWDNGPGVPDADKKRIFEKFHQVRPGKMSAGQGIGLGLEICRAIVLAHGGIIGVEDNPAGGSIFVVSIKSASPVHAVPATGGDD